MRSAARIALYRVLAAGVAILLTVASTDSAVYGQDTLWHTWRNGGLQAMQEGRLGDAERLFIAALEQAEKFGADNLRVAEAANDLAVVYAAAGNTVKAELLFHRSLLIGEHGLGPDHPAVGTTIQNLGILYAMQYKYQEAEPLLKRALEIDLKRFGATHTRTALTLKTLSSFYAVQGRLAEAEQFIRKSLAILEAGSVQQGDPQMTTTLQMFAAILRNTNREREAQEIERRLGAGAIVYQ
ncbi:MAG: tetratricopeptide repeat protein [Nitrospirae bacterium]|nr:tetratricopeptide repeat protein [Nitrospirota bacterium]